MSMHETHLCGARNSSEGDDEKDVFDMRHDCACFVCGAAVVGGRCWQAVDFLAPFPSQFAPVHCVLQKVTRFQL